MSTQAAEFVHQTAVEVYGAFLDECVVSRVIEDRTGPKGKISLTRIDGRPVRLVTISGKGGYSTDPELAERWGHNDNISLLDHLLSVARGALMFWLADALRPWSDEEHVAEIEWLAYAVVCIAFLHDIDKDLDLPRGKEIDVTDVEERMHRYGIDKFLTSHHISISPAAMLNYIEQVEGTQAARSPAAPDYDRRIAATCRYVELADKLEGSFTSDGVDGLLSELHNRNALFPVLQDSELGEWAKVEIHDHLHVFLLDRFQRALSETCKAITGYSPLIEIVHDGRLLCLVPREQADKVKKVALDSFLRDLPYGLRFAVNNRLACEFVGGAASWEVCRDVMYPRRGNWREFANLLALPRSFARERYREIDELFEAAGMTTSWSPLDPDASGATVKPALDHPGGDAGDLGMEPAHAVAFLTIALNHKDASVKTAAPDADCRERELVENLRARGKEPPPVVASAPEKDARARRVLLALWTIGEVWRLSEEDSDEAKVMLDAILGREGLVGLWLEGDDSRRGLQHQVEDVASDILNALCARFSAYLSERPALPFDTETPAKRCILCNEPVTVKRRIDSASQAHGVKVSAFSGRDGRNDHLASSKGDTHLCLVCLAELQLRQKAQSDFKGSDDLPPLISSPVTVGLFGGLAFDHEDSGVSMGLFDLNRLEIKKGIVYKGLDCHMRRIRVARLEALPNRDAELVVHLHLVLRAIRRLGRPIHIFRGAPRRHPAIFYSDALPAWLEKLLDKDFQRTNSLRIEQIPKAISRLELFGHLAAATGLGIEWAKQLAYSDTELGALCVAWALAVDRRGDGDKDHAWSLIEKRTRERIKNTGGEPVNLKDSQDPLSRLAWLASRIQKRIGIGASTSKQLLCWKAALGFYPSTLRSITQDRDALVQGLAGTLYEELTRKGDQGANEHRDNQPLDQACIDFAAHFADTVWPKVFRSKEPTSQEQRRTAAIYRFRLLEAYRERDISETRDDAPTDDETSEAYLDGQS
ncbi:MAG: hypothetical protein OXC09_10200 [Truepera sp.]|nr:hypothetical protein [Truepera sp.]